MKAEYVAYWQLGGGDQELLHPDLPLSGVEMTMEAGVGRLTGTLPAEFAQLKNHNGRLVLQEWATAIYVYLDGSFRDAFLISELSDNGQQVTLDCVGFAGYMTGQPWTWQQYRWRNTAFSTVMDTIARDIPMVTVFDPDGTHHEAPLADQAGRGPNAGFVEPDYTGSFPKLGNPEPGEIKDVPANYPEPKEPKESKSKPTYPKYKTRNFRHPVRSNYKTKAAYDKAVKAYKKKDAAWQKWKKGYDKAVKKYHKDLDAYNKAHKEFLKGPKKKWQKAHAEWKSRQTEIKNVKKQNEETRKSAELVVNVRETMDIMATITGALEESDGLYRVEHSNITATHAEHRFHFYQSKIRRNKSVEFIDGENVMEIPVITTRTGATRVTVQGASDGPDGDKSAVDGQNVPTGRPMGLHRTVVHTDKRLRTKAARAARAEKLAAVYSGRTNVKEVKVINHADAPFGTYGVGDEVSYRSWDRRGLSVDQWARIESITVSPETELVTLALTIIGEV